MEVLISRLHIKLAPCLDGGFDIRALRGQGYQLGFVLEINGGRQVGEWGGGLIRWRRSIRLSRVKRPGGRRNGFR